MEFWDLNISLIVMVFMILLVRKLGNRYIPKRVVTLLWNLIIIRALVPCKISISSIPILKNLKGIFSASQNTVVLPKISANVQEAFSQNTILNSGEMLNTWALLKTVWILGVFFTGVYFLRIYYAQYRELRKSVPVHNEIAERVIRSVSLRRKVSLFACESFSSPVTHGILHPKIVIPMECSGISRVDMRNMMMHELIHIKRFDVAKKYLVAFVLCLYWYNPFIWLMYHFYQEDQEMACDESVLESMSQEEAKGYIYTMIKMSVESKAHLTFTGFWEKGLGKKRILSAINQHRGKRSYLTFVIPAGVVMLLSFVSFEPATHQGILEVTADREGSKTVAGNNGLEAEWDDNFYDYADATTVMEPNAESQNDRKDSEVEEEETEFVRMSDEEYERVMKDIRENYNDPYQKLTEEQERALRQQRLDQAEEIFNDMQFNLR